MNKAGGFGSEDIRLQRELKKLVPEYPLHILDLNEVIDYSKFQTELRTVFELYRCRNDKRKFREYVEEQDMDVGSAIWDIREEGVQEGLSQGIRALVETFKEFGCTKEEAVAKLMEKCALSQSEAEKYAEEYGY